MKTISNLNLCIGLAVILLLSGCDDFLDVNNNPNSPESAPLNLQLPSIIAGFSFGMDDGFPGRVSASWTQQISHNGDLYYYNVDQYQLGQPWFAFNDVWNLAYTDLAKNARVAYMQAEDQDYANFEGIGKLIYVWTMSIMTDLYGDIPYSEAFNPSNQTPVYDSQQTIYTELFTLLDEAITAFEEGGERTLGSSDILYGGDMDKWTRLAYTLKARMLMRLTEAPGIDRQQQASEALAALGNGFQSNADNAVFSYNDENDARNPWYPISQQGAVEHIQMSAHYIDMLESLNDPRLPIHADTTDIVDDDQYTGHVNGAPGVLIDSVSAIGSAFLAPDAGNALIDYAEAKFLEAQALLITQGSASADMPYREAIRADMEALGVPDAEIITYISARPNLAGTTNPLQDIINQKYIANFLNPEAWNDWRKTGYPELLPAQYPENSDPNFDTIPRRYPWPGTELSNNAEQVEALGLPLNFEIMQEKVWWDTR